MLTTVMFRSSNTDFYPDLTIPVVDPSPDQPLFIHNITGLEPPPATVNSRGYGSLNGEFYVGSHIGKRNIVFTFGLNETSGYASVSNARSIMSGYMMVQGQVLLRFISNDRAPVDIEGYVETWTPNRFSQDPEIQVSIICPIPNFTAIEGKEFTGLASNNPDDTVVPYHGTLTSGIELEMELPGSGLLGDVYIEIGIFHGSYRQFVIEDVVAYVGDSFIMGSQPNNKYVKQLQAEGPPVNLFSYVTNLAYWPYLQPADNLVRVRTPGSTDELAWTLRFVEQYASI